MMEFAAIASQLDAYLHMPARAHLIVAPILLPLVTAAIMLALGERRRRLKALVNILSTLLGVLIAALLVSWVHHDIAPGGLAEVGAIGIYLPSNWQAPFGIVLAVDRLSALMLLLTSLLALGAIMFAVARWDRAGVHFHPLFQIQLMGLNGAFLTADLFNLFVFFEVLLAASYGLLLHASGSARVKAGLHYIAINLVASSLFLIGAALTYGVTGTLNMADLAVKVGEVADADRGLLQAGAALLAIAFLTKAGMWPLNFWLVPAYSAAGAPVAALFVIMTKVGVYAVLRIWTLLFSSQSGQWAGFGMDWLLIGGLATLSFGTVGLLASRQLGRLASYSIIVSSGTLLAAIGFGQPALTGGALYYLISSTLGISAMFLLIELIDRSRIEGMATPVDEGDYIPFPTEDMLPPGTNLDEAQEALIGRAIPAAMAFLGLGFIACTLLITGMPPLSGFVGKILMLSALLNPLGMGGPDVELGPAQWTLLALLIGSGLTAMISLSRTGIRYFWAYPQGRPAPRLRVVECLPIALLLVVCIVLTIRAEPVVRYLRATADALYSPTDYIMSVLSTRPVPSPKTASGDGP
jgi:multicomponent K+:H+ antiporter subunit D